MSDESSCQWQLLEELGGELLFDNWTSSSWSTASEAFCLLFVDIKSKSCKPARVGDEMCVDTKNSREAQRSEPLKRQFKGLARQQHSSQTGNRRRAMLFVKPVPLPAQLLGNVNIGVRVID
jgi:hypothetical protein